MLFDFANFPGCKRSKTFRMGLIAAVAMIRGIVRRRIELERTHVIAQRFLLNEYYVQSGRRGCSGVLHCSASRLTERTASRASPPGAADVGLSGQRTRSKSRPARPEGYKQSDESRGEVFGGWGVGRKSLAHEQRGRWSPEGLPFGAGAWGCGSPQSGEGKHRTLNIEHRTLK